MIYEISIKNQVTGASIIIARRAEMANTFLARFLGLMFRASFGAHDAMVLSPCGSIHTFFMRFAIDVVCTDPTGKVVDYAKTVRPWRLFVPRWNAKTTLELPSGAIRQHAIAIGDQICIQPHA